MTHDTNGSKNIFTLIRHGSTVLNNRGRLRGWFDVPLDTNGIQEAHELGEQLKNAGIEYMISSDLVRATETAQIISNIIKAPIIETTDALRPWHVGEATGKDIFEMLPILQDHATNRPTEAISGGESFHSFRDRFLGGLRKIFDDHSGKHFAIVTHHRGDRVIAAWEATNFSDTFDIDLDIFLQKGIEPACFRHVTYTVR